MMRPLHRFWFVLALALGATVGELQSRMGSHEFSEWLAFYQIQPFGQIKDDYRSGMICATIGNLFIEKGKKGVAPGDFFDLDPWQAQSSREVAPNKISDKVSDETLAFLEAIGAVREGGA